MERFDELLSASRDESEKSEDDSRGSVDDHDSLGDTSKRKRP